MSNQSYSLDEKWLRSKEKTDVHMAYYVDALRNIITRLNDPGFSISATYDIISETTREIRCNSPELLERKVDDYIEDREIKTVGDVIDALELKVNPQENVEDPAVYDLVTLLLSALEF